jgi:hypothetical protein
MRTLFPKQLLPVLQAKRDKDPKGSIERPSSPNPFSQGGRRGAGAQSEVSCPLSPCGTANVSPVKLVPLQLQQGVSSHGKKIRNQNTASTMAKYLPHFSDRKIAVMGMD